MYDDPLTAKKAAEFIKKIGIKTIEDWGCGYGGFRNYIGDFQEYIGIDGSQSRYTDKIVDLEKYTSNIDAIHIRHVLEHNIHWVKILENAIQSFQNCMVLTIFTPFVQETTIVAEYPNFENTGITMVDIAFKREDIVKYFANLQWTSEENIKTETQYGIEHMFFLQKIS